MASSKAIASILGTGTYNGELVTNIWKVVNTSKYSSINFYDEYIITDYDRWDTVSNKFYDTPALWWILANYNKIKDPFTELIPGNTIKIIKKELVASILHKLKGITN